MPVLSKSRSLCLRYVDLKDVKQHKVKEMFLEYIPTVDVTGSGLINLIITALKKHGLNNVLIWLVKWAFWRCPSVHSLRMSSCSLCTL